MVFRQVNFSENSGHIYLLGSKDYITESVTLSGNTGGAIHAIQSQVCINSSEKTVISNNSASSGGGIMLRESELVAQSPIFIYENVAQMFGGGIYAYQSGIDFTAKRKSFIINNFAYQSGGGVYLVASTFKHSRSYVAISSNTALISGGRLFLQENSKLYLLKKKKEKNTSVIKLYLKLAIINNSATYGGGIYVADNSTTAGLHCQGSMQLRDKNDDVSVSPDCFIQTIQLSEGRKMQLFPIGLSGNRVNTYLINNTAESGSALY